MTSMTVEPAEPVVRRQIIIGVDTHKYVHVAVALDHLGARLAAQHVAAEREGYAQLEAWAASLAGNGRVVAYSVEGTGSYGVGLASFLRRAATVSSRSTVVIAAVGAATARATPSTPGLPHALCSADRPPLSPNLPTAPPR